MTKGGGRSFTFGPSSGIEPFAFPGLRGDIEAIQRDLLGGMSDLMEAAEAMTNEFFRSFDMRPHHDNHNLPSFNFPKPPVAGPSYKEVPIQGGGGSVDDAYKDLPGEVTDV
ncbi:hypothetical protein QJS10_CPA08g00006 [Acorus calamus]|uniref:Uncharacterized protein n=1 Tax=Acorus calamus TaxID=4465 RepID=A0AAV9E8H9_ACOCL|nr:hypothetical protein QJS10_CPA08g00006 [Acorus calamus]